MQFLCIVVLVLNAAYARGGDVQPVAVEMLAGGIAPGWSGQQRVAELGLDLVLLAGSGWEVEELTALIAQVAQTYAQCGVHLARVRWRKMAVQEQWLDFSSQSARQLASTLAIERPAAFLVRDTRQLPAFDAEAIGAGNSRTRPELRDTVWLTRALPHPAVGLAHELFHVLTDSGAHDLRANNLMRADSAPGNIQLEPDQCRAMRDSPLLVTVKDR